MRHILHTICAHFWIQINDPITHVRLSYFTLFTITLLLLHFTFTLLLLYFYFIFTLFLLCFYFTFTLLLLYFYCTLLTLLLICLYFTFLYFILLYFYSTFTSFLLYFYFTFTLLLLLLYFTLPTPWCTVLLEKPTGFQLVKKFPAFHGTRMFITALTSACHLSLTLATVPVHPGPRLTV